MPSKNAIKTYVPDGYYHIYNRGTNKRAIFKDQQDYSVFLSYLKTYLLLKDTEKLLAIISNPQSTPQDKHQSQGLLALNNFFGRIELLAYCLMSNHFHFLLHQIGDKDLQIFMGSCMTRYTKYFNHRYERIGPLFQSRYKAVLIESDPQLLYLTRYIHRNCIDEKNTQPICQQLFRQPSSYGVYINKFKQEWVKPEFILQNFSESGFNSYQSFIEDTDPDLEVKSATIIDKFSLDSEED